MDRAWSDGMWTALAELRARLATILPGLATMVGLVVVGVVLGFVVRALVLGIARLVRFDRHAERWGLAGALRRAGILRAPSETLGVLGFWIVFVIFATVGIDAVDAQGRWVATAFLLAMLPSLFAALLILVVGWLVANFVSQGLLIAAVNAGLPEARLLARAVHWGIVLFAVATALTQLGIGKEMVLVAFGITFGGLVLALALAFGLGGRHLARDLLLRRLRRGVPPERERLTHL